MRKTHYLVPCLTTKGLMLKRACNPNFDQKCKNETVSFKAVTCKNCIKTYGFKHTLMVEKEFENL